MASNAPHDMTTAPIVHGHTRSVADTTNSSGFAAWMVSGPTRNITMGPSNAGPASRRSRCELPRRCQRDTPARRAARADQRWRGSAAITHTTAVRAISHGTAAAIARSRRGGLGKDGRGRQRRRCGASRTAQDSKAHAPAMLPVADDDFMAPFRQRQQPPGRARQLTRVSPNHDLRVHQQLDFVVAGHVQFQRAPFRHVPEASPLDAERPARERRILPHEFEADIRGALFGGGGGRNRRSCERYGQNPGKARIPNAGRPSQPSAGLPRARWRRQRTRGAKGSSAPRLWTRRSRCHFARV